MRNVGTFKSLKINLENFTQTFFIKMVAQFNIKITKINDDVDFKLSKNKFKSAIEAHLSINVPLRKIKRLSNGNLEFSWWDENAEETRDFIDRHLSETIVSEIIIETDPDSFFNE